MRLLTEVWEQYSVSQNQAKRNIRRCVRTGMETALPTLESVVDRTKSVGSAVSMPVLTHLRIFLFA